MFMLTGICTFLVVRRRRDLYVVLLIEVIMENMYNLPASKLKIRNEESLEMLHSTMILVETCNHLSTVMSTAGV